MSQKFTGVYKGIVVQNNDPEKRGRLKVFIPHLSASVYSRWDKTNTNKKFKFPGANIDSPLSDIIKDLKDILPWAEPAGPVMGGGGPGLYSAFKDSATVSDSNVDSQRQPGIPSALLAKYKANNTGIGEKAGKQFEVAPIKDAFTDNKEGQKVNPYGNCYTPSTYSNVSKGSYSVPNVGSQVWCFFNDSNHNFPVYFAMALSGDDFRGIFDSNVDYPSTCENKDSRDTINTDPDLTQYRNKYVFNQKGGTFEVVNTDSREAIKLTHFNGSFLEFNNFTSTIFSANNSQTLVKRDSFSTVYGNESTYTGMDMEHIIKGDSITKIGNLSSGDFADWLAAVSPAHALRLLPVVSDSAVASAVKAATPTLSVLEQKMGFGGSDIKTITKNQVETVGAGMNTLQTLRVVAAGRTLDSLIGPSSVIQSPFEKLTRVQAFDSPGGTKTSNIGNRWVITVGAGGYDLKTYGPVDISGPSVTVAGDQVTVAAAKELNIDSKNYLAIASKTLVLKAKNNGQVIVSKSGLGVERNVIVLGGVYIKGELGVQHISGPLEWHVTEPTDIIGQITIDNIVVTGGTGVGDNGGTSTWTQATKMVGTISGFPTHTHRFKSIPMDYTNPVAAVATACADNATAVEAKAVAAAPPSTPNGPAGPYP